MRIFPTLFKTGRHAARRARAAADEEMARARAERAELDEQKKREKMRANRIKVRALRSRRGAQYFAEGERRETIG